MSDSYRHEPGLDDASILGVLESFRKDSGAHAGVKEDSEADLVKREYTELLGLLPYALEPRAPSPAVKERLLETTRSLRSEHVGGAPGWTRAGAAKPSAAAPGWLLPLAASVAFVLVAVTGWLVLQVRDQQSQIAELSAQLEQARLVASALSTSRDVLAEVRSRLDLATAPGTEFCPLRPPAGSPDRGARGVVVMHPVRDDWFLHVQGLEPCSQGRRYVVWFSTEAGSQQGPIFVVKTAGEPVELTVTGMPPNVDAIMITLEADPSSGEPSAEPLLFGNERMQLL